MNAGTGYDAAGIEARWQATWARGRWTTPDVEAGGGAAAYVFACPPFTSGGIHMGHVRSYTIADACARYARGRGRRVLWSMGFDAFGLPAETAAARSGDSPRTWVDRCVETMTRQLRRLGLSCDWQRTFTTCDASYYRWSQWVFLRLYERGMVRRANGVEHWCGACESVLAAQQVDEEGRCWRCGGRTSFKSVPQWHVHMLPLAQALDPRPGSLPGWDERVVACEREQIGCTRGVEVDLVGDDGTPLTAFCAHPDAVLRARFVCLPPDLPDVQRWMPHASVSEALNEQRRRGLSRSDRQVDAVPALVTGRSARFAGAGTALPIVVSPAASRVDAHGAVLGVPARDRWAQAIADRLDGADRSDPGPDVVLRPAVRWRLRDFSISRQRSWGAPVPMLHCGQCGAVPVPDEQLPVLLPEDPPSDRASQGAEHDAVGTCRCPRCGGHARRDPDTLDCHLDSFWMLVPFCVPAAARDRSMFTHADLAYWLPAYQVVCGVDQASWWLNDRLTFRALRDLGFLRGVQGDEPIASLATHEMVLCEGVKMSKSRGNAVDPDAMVVRFGADAVRLAVLATPSHRPLEWDDAIVARQRALLERVWSLCARLLHDPRPPAITRRAASSRHRAWTAAAIRQTTRACESRRFDAALRSIETLTSTLWRCQEEGRRAFGADEGRECVSVLARLLEPLAPHIAEELWSQLGAANDCAAAPWPVAPPTQSGGNHRPAAERGSHCQS